jgi:mycothiol system anti-sigma-R factor
MPALIGIPGGVGGVSRRGRERARKAGESPGTAPLEQRSTRRIVSMNCDAVRAVMYSASDNELDGELLLSFRQHLTLCASCSHRYGFVSRMLAIVRGRCCRYEAPTTLRIRILASFPHRGDVVAGAVE